MQSLQAARAACARVLCAPALAKRGAAGTRFASSSAGGASRSALKAFPVFRNSAGVIECNEFFFHPVTAQTAAAAAARHPNVGQPSAASQKAAKLAELYADLVTTRELESPILLQSVAMPTKRAGFAGARSGAKQARQDVQSLA